MAADKLARSLSSHFQGPAMRSAPTHHHLAPNALMTVLLMVLLTACTIPGLDGTASTEGTSQTDADAGGTTGTVDFQGCDENRIDYIGPDEPVVGDEWIVWLYCDEALLNGPMVLRFDPLDFASVADNVATWRLEGTGTMFVQTGSQRAEMEVTVGP
ncbi:MAG: hypothetical protein GXP62_04600 [Oligoflexia bacterium]|nr:hypothetical protein [Oligoflexia bacterium]